MAKSKTPSNINSTAPQEAPVLIALQNAGKIDPANLSEYEQAGGFEALRQALQHPPEKIFQEVIDSGLQGRGGAGFPTGVKEKLTEESLCEACGPKYVVCNADEGEPGTFKDRAIMERDPHKVLEGLIISAYAIGAAQAYIYIRGEYTESIRRIRRAMQNCYDAGYLGGNILDSPFSLEVYIRLGAGSYLCGEELTLLESLEGKRGYPRIKPPFPAQHGLFGAPTLINNVETFAHIPYVVRNGAQVYRRLGMEDSPGTKVFTVSGDVQHPGIYEVELGITLRQLLETHCGGVRSGHRFKAALIGGAAGSLVSEALLDVPMGYQSLKSQGAVLGSGAVIIFDETRDLGEPLQSVMEFFRHESCGKCIPCRIGTVLLEQMAEKLASRPAGSRGELLNEMTREAEYMDRTSLCPLGKSPILSLGSAQRFFGAEF
ncbi:MAG: NADH-ubiquinone oxidoreductase-F iron-sulfur binding region domain-containing protein [Spirochaetia bacterium]